MGCGSMKAHGTDQEAHKRVCGRDGTCIKEQKGRSIFFIHTYEFDLAYIVIDMFVSFLGWSSHLNCVEFSLMV